MNRDVKSMNVALEIEAVTVAVRPTQRRLQQLRLLKSGNLG